jgi:ComF family protein
MSLCKSCGRRSPFDAFFVVGEYGGMLEALVRSLKFERKYAAYKPLSELMFAALPSFDIPLSSLCIVPIPTAAKRIRLRGYDQVMLLARSLSRRLKIPARSVLVRNHQLRQLGASQAIRRKQAESAFSLHTRTTLKGMSVILIDDVVTTGATLEAAAKLLKQAGAERVIGLIAAYQPLK